MKKLLALVLALVMVMGLATVGANAAVYSDAKDIDYTEAVDVMSALGVFDGMDGAFNPKGTLTREQGAKIISYMILGKKAADSLSTAGAPFDDVASDRWSAGAIAYCTSEKIIGGVGNNQFNPEGELTGYAFAKMLLVALGYNPEVEGLVGESWSINTAKLAISAGLKKGLTDLVMGTGITREEACQMAFNTEKATLVNYPNNTTVRTGDVTVVTTSNASKVAADDEGYKTGADDVNDDYVQFCERYADKLTLQVADANKVDDFGRPANTWKLSNTEIGTYASAADYIYTGKVTRGTLYDVYGKSNVNNDDLTLTVWIDGEKLAGDDAPDKDNYFVSGSSASIGATGFTTGAGSTTEVWIDDDSNMTIVTINEYVMQAAADYNTRTETLTVEVPGTATAPVTSVAGANLKLSSDDFAVTDVKADDYLIVTVAAGEIQSVEPAKELTGKVNGYVGSKNVTIDGTTYSYVGNIADEEDGKAAEYTVGEDATVILDANNNIIYVDSAVTNSNWVYIAKVAEQNSLSDNFIATAIFTDGTTDTITLKNYKAVDGDATDEDLDDTVDPGWYKYTVTSAKTYKLFGDAAAKSQGTTAADTKLIENGKVGITGTEDYGNNATVYIVKNTDKDYDVYTGVANAPTLTTKTDTKATVSYVLKSADGHVAKFVYVDASSNITIDDAASAATDLIYLLGNGTTGGVNTADGKKYYTFAALVDGQQTTLNISDEADFVNAGEVDVSDKTAGAGILFYKARTNSDGYVTSLTNAVAKTNIVTDAEISDTTVGYSGGVLSLDGETYLAENAKVYLVVYKTAPAVMDDPGQDYELNITNASGLKSALSGYKFTEGVYTVVYKDATAASGEVSEIYISVKTVTAAD